MNFSEIKKITSNNRNIGGIGLFIGVVRDGDQKLKSMTLEHYPIMTEKMLELVLRKMFWVKLII